MINKRDLKFSKFLSLVLRHAPEKANIVIDKNGYTDVNILIAHMNEMGMDITKEDLDRIVKEDDKQRYSYDLFDADNKIRANQGHSILVDLELKSVSPPLELYHGTTVKNLDSIFKNGISKMCRNFVHLSDDIKTAYNVGSRYGTPTILKIDVYNMIKDGYVFYQSENGVYLTDNVPSKYITEL